MVARYRLIWTTFVVDPKLPAGLEQYATTNIMICAPVDRISWSDELVAFHVT